MPTSQPWNPNDTSLTDEDRARGYIAYPCMSYDCGPDCMWCGGQGEVREAVREFRPDKKLRAVAWLPHGEFGILFWDEGTLGEFRDLVRRGDEFTRTVRGWDHAAYEVRPSAVTLFRKTDQ